jgi:hypothetical protein
VPCVCVIVVRLSAMVAVLPAGRTRAGRPDERKSLASLLSRSSLEAEAERRHEELAVGLPIGGHAR